MADVRQAALEKVDHVLVVECIIHLPTVPGGTGKVQGAQHTQLVGYSRLAHADPFGDLANIQFPIEQGFDDPQAARVAHGFEKLAHITDVFGRNSHGLSLYMNNCSYIDI